VQPVYTIFRCKQLIMLVISSQMTTKRLSFPFSTLAVKSVPLITLGHLALITDWWLGNGAWESGCLYVLGQVRYWRVATIQTLHPPVLLHLHYDQQY